MKLHDTETATKRKGDIMGDSTFSVNTLLLLNNPEWDYSDDSDDSESPAPIPTASAQPFATYRVWLYVVGGRSDQHQEIGVFMNSTDAHNAMVRAVRSFANEDFTYNVCQSCRGETLADMYTNEVGQPLMWAQSQLYCIHIEKVRMGVEKSLPEYMTRREYYGVR
jgi:hypothetical protein